MNTNEYRISSFLEMPELLEGKDWELEDREEEGDEGTNIKRFRNLKEKD